MKLLSPLRLVGFKRSIAGQYATSSGVPGQLPDTQTANVIAGSFGVSLFIDLGYPSDLFYDN